MLVGVTEGPSQPGQLGVQNSVATRLVAVREVRLFLKTVNIPMKPWQHGFVTRTPSTAFPLGDI